MTYPVPPSQPHSSISEMTLFATEGEQIAIPLEESSDFSSRSEGSLKTPSQKTYRFSAEPKETFSKADALFSQFSEKSVFSTQPFQTLSLKKPSPLQLAQTLASQTKKEFFPSPVKETMGQRTLNPTESKEGVKKGDSPSPLPPTMKGEMTPLSKSRALEKNHPLAQNKESAKREGFVSTKKWTPKETLPFWEARYHQKEKERDPNHKKGTEAIEAASSPSKKGAGTYPGSIFAKPQLERPKTGIFALYYILTKIGILSDAASNFDYKTEIQKLDVDTTTCHQKRLDELKIALSKEQSAKRWGVAVKVISWMTAATGIIAGLFLIATGVGAIAGAMLIAAGIFQITSQILELTGGWQKIAEKLPGDDPEKKRAVISWIQIGIVVLGLILSGVGMLTGGFSNLSEMMQLASNLMGAIAITAHGAVQIGEGVATYFYKNKISEVKRYEIKLAELKHRRQDLMEKVEWGMDRLGKLFEDLSQSLGFYEELFIAEQSINR